MSDMDNDELKATREHNGAVICIGDYIRDCDGFIYKVTEITPEKDSYDVYYKGEGIFGTYLSMTKKHSSSIIDLIEINDYVNGYKVLDINAAKGWLDVDCNKPNDQCMILESEIKSVVTHEQFKCVKYIVKEE